MDEGLRARLLRAYQEAITPLMRAQMASDDPQTDPIAAQFIPDARELDDDGAALDDPIGDARHSPLPQLVHRYRNRVLWTLSPTCAVYCRFCFRKEHIGRKGHALTAAERRAALDYIAHHDEIDEVILSGGDPLQLTCSGLKKALLPLKNMAHVRRLRIHSRIPIVAPERLTPETLQLLETLGKTWVVVLHINHPHELSAAALAKIAELRQRGALLCSQSVLLRGVNDCAATLAELFNALLDCGVMPYYLHHLDLARGTRHFRLSLDEGLALYAALKTQVSGIALPTYIVEIPGGGGKIPVISLTPQQRAELNALGID